MPFFSSAPYNIFQIVDQTAGRAWGNVYTNTSSRTLIVIITTQHNIVGDLMCYITAVVAGSIVAQSGHNWSGTPVGFTATEYSTITFLVPPGSTYELVTTAIGGNSNTLGVWIEAQ